MQVVEKDFFTYCQLYGRPLHKKKGSRDVQVYSKTVQFTYRAKLTIAMINIII